MSAPGYPVEVNTSNLAAGRTDMKISDEMVALADRIVVNTDAHSLSDMTTRPMGLDYLRAGGYSSSIVFLSISLPSLGDHRLDGWRLDVGVASSVPAVSECPVLLEAVVLIRGLGLDRR